MESASSVRGPWGRRVWKVIGTLTAIGLIGVGIVFGELFVASWRAIGPGCQVGGGPPIYGFLSIGVAALVVLAALAGLGLLMFRLQSPAGPLVLVLSNLVVLSFYGFMSPVDVLPDQRWLALLIVVVAGTPAVATAVLGWPLATRGPLWARVVELTILTVIAVPVVWLYGHGLTNDIGFALAPPAQQAVFSPNPGSCV